MTSSSLSDPMSHPSVESLDTAAYRIPTDRPESDGTMQWNATTLVTVHVRAGGQQGFGYTYAPSATATLIRDNLSELVLNQGAFAIERLWQTMVRRVRNAGLPGIAAAAISAIDTALWDLKAKLLDQSLVQLWGAVRDGMMVYGSGGFTSYSVNELQMQLSGWSQQGIRHVKMKVGSDAAQDPTRVAAARRAVGSDVQLLVDANGAYDRNQALRMAQVFAEQENVTWFEEPVSSNDLQGLRLLRDRGPAGMEIAAGEYGYTPWYFQQMLAAQAVDCLQADATRCGGFTGFRKVSALCEAYQIPLSAHCAPQLHAHLGCCSQPLRHIEYFHDHVRISKMLFDGALVAEEGQLRPNPARPGHGLTLKHPEAEKYKISDAGYVCE